MRAVLLGGNGFIGSNLAEALVERGDSVRIFHRPGQSSLLPDDVASSIERVEGDFTNPEDVRAAIEGSDAVYHLVSTTLPNSRHPILGPVMSVKSWLFPDLSSQQATKSPSLVA